MAFYVASDGCHIHYDLLLPKQTKTGSNLIVLIPGLSGDGRFWDGVRGYLQEDYSLLIVDHRGSGRSDRPLGRYSIKQIAEDFVAIINMARGLACAKSVHVIGHSAGGAVAQEVALIHPDLAASYIISSSWARCDVRFRALFTARAQMLESGCVEAYQHLTHILCYTPTYLQEHDRELACAVTQASQRLMPLSVQVARVQMLLDHDRLDDLGAISRPVQIVAARDDILIPFELTQQMFGKIKGAQLIEVEGGHFHPLARPQGFANIVRQFVQRQIP